MSTQPVVVVPAQLDLDAEIFGLRRRYVKFLQDLGIIAVVLPPLPDIGQTSTVLSEFDGLLLSGGVDVDPCLYGQSHEEGTAKPIHERDALEISLIKEAKRLHMPILGICRGFQVMNVAYGGTLHQKIDDSVSTVTHWQEEPYDRPSHEVTIRSETLLGKILGGGALDVNSMHHQGVDVLGKGLEMAATDECGLIEAAFDPSEEFLLGVQWHPEYAPKLESSQLLGKAFLDACKSYKARKAIS